MAKLPGHPRTKWPCKILTPKLIAILATGLSTTAAAAATTQTSHDHAAMMAQETGTPTEPGQGALAAIAEIVALLTEDPETDWAKVDIDALRLHLVDMDTLVTFSEVTQQDSPDGAVFRARLTGPGGGAVSRMMPAYAPVLAAETGWTSTAQTMGDRVVWTVTSPDNAAAIRALGFFGLIAVGGHHPDHHLGMATGRMVH